MHERILLTMAGDEKVGLAERALGILRVCSAWEP
jgi:hypothetical protein